MTADRPLRVLLDEMFSGAVATDLRDRGFDVVAVVDEPTLVSSPDVDVLVRATSEQRAVVTADVRDFSVIASDWRARGRIHHGIVYVPSRAFPQTRSQRGLLTAAVAALCVGGALPPGAEVFLAQAP